MHDNYGCRASCSKRRCLPDHSENALPDTLAVLVIPNCRIDNLLRCCARKSLEDEVNKRYGRTETLRRRRFSGTEDVDLGTILCLPLPSTLSSNTVDSEYAETE